VDHGHSDRDRSQIYLDTLPLFTTGRARLIESDRLVAQFAGLVRTTSPGGRDKVDHGKTGADDLCNSAAGVMALVAARSERVGAVAIGVETFGSHGSAGGIVRGDKYLTADQIRAERPPPPVDHLDFVWNEIEGRWGAPRARGHGLIPDHDKEKTMFEFIRRIFAGTAPESNAEQLRSGGYRQRNVIENRSPPIPDITQAANADAIAQIFALDAARQEMESTRSSTHGAISFNPPRNRASNGR
jgi:hypothetical protein